MLLACTVVPGGEPPGPVALSPTDPPTIESRTLEPLDERPAGAPLFELVPPERTGVSFRLGLPDFAGHIHELIHLSLYGGVCTGDYDGDGRPDFYVTSPVGGNRLFRNLGGFRFEDATEAAHVSATNFWGTGAVFVDVNNDGLLDLYACAYDAPNRLFINTGADAAGEIRFAEKAHEFGLDHRGASMMMAFGDLDRDGDLDGYLATTALLPPPGARLRFEQAGDKPTIPKDLQEYWALLYLPDGRAYPTEAGQFDHLYRNDGGHFTEITSEAGIDGPYFTLSAQWWDYDADGWPDLYVANDYFGPDRLYRNNHDGTFSDVISQVVPHTPWSSMSSDVGDLNHDGRLDLIVTDMIGSTHHRWHVMLGDVTRSAWFLEWADPPQYRHNAVYLSSGDGRMLEAAFQLGMAATDWTWGPRIEDFDNDGRQDVIFCNGMLRDVQHSDLAATADRTYGGGSKPWAGFWAKQPMQRETNLAFRNLGSLQFQRVEKDWGLDRLGISLGAATADFDGDGDLDLIVSNADAPVSLYRNRSQGANRMKLRLRGRRSNRFGINATVRVRAGGQEQVRYLTANRGWLSGSEPVAHFGLGTADIVEQLTMEWPSGTHQSFSNLSVNSLHTITEPAVDMEKPAPAATEDKPDRPLFHRVELLDSVTFGEPPFDDFAEEPLLPRKLSARGGRLAWGDVNGDGQQALYLYVASPPGNTNRLYLRHGTPGFRPAPQPAMVANQDCEDADAVFLDFDRDGDRDLFVAGGGVRQPAGDRSYRHRLYLNDGTGSFTDVSERFLPTTAEGAGCVAAEDFNGDGSIDLFLGGASVPGRYPLAGESRLWVNVAGRFEDRTPTILKTAGIVTAAIWADTVGDELPDLALATEWGPVRLYENQGGTLADRTQSVGLLTHTGWWNAIAAGDVDQDGDLDYVAGNHGLNSASRASPHQPELLFHGDLDNSGRMNLLRAYFIGEYGYPHDGYARMSQAMPLFSSRVPNYESFASANIEDLFTMDRLRKTTVREANTLESVLLINEARTRFRPVPLPPPAQIAPARDLALVDVDGNATLDLVIGQNDYSYNHYVGRMDGGVGLVLLGDGQGGFTPLAAGQSGLVVADEVRDLSVRDLNGDGRPDLAMVTSRGRLRACLNQGGRLRPPR